MPKVEDLLARWEGLQGDRMTWENHWQRLAELMLPKRADFTVKSSPGSRRNLEKYDSTPMMASRQLASAIDGLLKPKTTRWFLLRAADDELNDDDAVKAWISDTENRMYNAMYNRRARWLQSSSEVDLDLVVFGTGCMFVAEAENLSHLTFQSLHLKDTYVARNGDGSVDTMFLRANRTARQALQSWGDSIGPITKELLKDELVDEEVEYVQVVTPRNDRDPTSASNLEMPFASITIEVESGHKTKESGFEEFPFVVPTWDSASGENYGRSPGMLALPDANTLNAMGKTILKAGQKVVDPPLLAASDSIIGQARTFSGGTTYFDADVARQLSRFPIAPMDTGGNIPIGREMQNDTREQIWGAFFRNVLNLPIDRPQMTATEVLERKEEFTRTLGPVFGRLESDYTGAVVDRQFNIMQRAGAFAEPPEILRGREVRFEYQSPLEQSRKQQEAAGISRAFELLAPMVQLDPSIMDNFDGDEVAQASPDIFGLPSEWMRTPDQRDQLRQGRAELAKAEAQKADLERMADVGAKASQSGLLDKLQEGQEGEGGPQPGVPG